MASTSKKWFIGCGIGCGLMILISAGVGGGLYFAFKNVAGDVESIEDSYEAMEETYGSPHDFIPAADGSIAADRMVVFLAAREATKESRDKMAAILITLDDDEVDSDGNERAKSSVLDKIKAGMTLIPSIMTFIGERNEHLLEQGMGSGEYTYIYSLAYFNYLEKDLTDGPGFQVTGDNDGEDSSSSFNWGVNSSKEKGDTREKREKEIRRHMHKLQMSFLRNQIEKNTVSGTASAELVAALEEEKAAMEDGRRRLLWEDGLPEVIRASLEPFAEELDLSYSPILNVLEVGMVDQN